MEKWEKNHNFWAFPRSGTGTIFIVVDWYRYRIFGTGTQCSILDHCSYFGHKLAILIRFE